MVNQLDDLQAILYYAHPDDENNNLLVYLNRKLGADTIYATLSTQGRGGDNSIRFKASLRRAGRIAFSGTALFRSFDGSTQMSGRV